MKDPSKTEKPTQKRIDDARSKGSVAKSNDANTAVILLVSLLMIRSQWQGASQAITELFRTYWERFPTTDWTSSYFLNLCWVVLAKVLMVTAPFFLTILAAGMLINFVQVGRLASWKAIKPDLKRINPITGFQRFFSGRQFVEVGKGLLKIFVIIFVAYQVLAERLAPISAALTTPTDSLGAVLADTAWTIAWRCVWVLVFIGIADYVYQRYEYMESLKMTKQEVEDEQKQAEVPREVKSKMKERQYQQARSRMMQEIPKASVVITNPTHLAIALKYERKEEEVPLCVAKGADKLAEKIKEIARENKVPIVENVPVARALYKDVEVGDEIPRELYATVAEILVMVTKLNKRRSRV